jgi:transcription antitermination factor NusG
LQHPQARSERNWYACYTRARHEKRVAGRLEADGFEVFLPLAAAESQWHDRKKIIEWPAFPGYVFARFELGRISAVTGMPGVVTIVTQGGRPAPIPDTEIENVRRFLEALGASGLEAEVAPLLELGQRVRFNAGPLEGVEASVIEDRGKHRVRVQVGLEAIGRGLKVDVERSQLQEI